MEMNYLFGPTWPNCLLSVVWGLKKRPQIHNYGLFAFFKNPLHDHLGVGKDNYFESTRYLRYVIHNIWH